MSERPRRRRPLCVVDERTPEEIYDGSDMPDDEIDAQLSDAWGAIADGVSDALDRLDRDHPERMHFMEILDVCRQAAGR